ncbi:uncharacterized protein LOC123671013 [Harmonia axyridis]|uniref:uncharacterized protein LOC123671013 n=1 Tax=Harmonia axyridis TaxID=115357 RepID=UPI001E27571C|nr:uncharacterized protein LOC123671013 [Harmonia axyridis]
MRFQFGNKRFYNRTVSQEVHSIRIIFGLGNIMKLVIWLLMLGVLNIYVVFAKPSKCAIENNIGKRDRIELSKNPYKPSEKILCFLKCDYERTGALRIDKTVDADKVVEHLNAWRSLKLSTKRRIKECVEEVKTQVNNCYDIEPYYHCVRKAIQLEVRYEMNHLMPKIENEE